MATPASTANQEMGCRSARLPEGPMLRACVTHDDTTLADVEVLVEELGLARSAG